MSDKTMGRVVRAAPTVDVWRWHGALPPELAEAWRTLQRRQATAQLVTCPEWSSFARQAGLISPCLLVVVRRADTPIGLFPLRLRAPGVAETVSLLVPDHPTFLIDDEFAEEALQGFAAWFAGQRAIHLLVLTPWTDSTRSPLLHAVLRRQRLVTRARVLAPTYWIPLPASWEAYLQTLGSSTRKSLRTTEKRLLRDFPDLQCTVLTTPSPASEAALRDFMRLYQQRWADQVGGSYFHDQHTAQFFLRTMRWALEAGLAAIAVLSLAEKPVAIATILRQPQRHDAIFHLIARDTRTLPGSYYAPGTLLNMRALQWAMAQGVTAVNIGCGKGEHKRLLGGQEAPVHEVTIARSAHALACWSLVDRGVHIVRRLPAHLRYKLRQAVKTRMSADELGRTRTDTD